MPNIMPKNLDQKRINKYYKSNHAYRCYESVAGRDGEYDVRVCKHEIVQAALRRDKDMPALDWEDLTWYRHPILRIKAGNALRKESNA
jgi:hypothetical protein